MSVITYFNIILGKDFAPLQYNGAFDGSKLGVVPFSQWYFLPTRIRGAGKGCCEGLPYSTTIEIARVVVLHLCVLDLKTLPRYKLMKIAYDWASYS
jgi:hypothetical protein